MRMIISRHPADAAWRQRYVAAWIALVLYGCLAFALGDKGVGPIGAQALFFVAYFVIALWPVSRLRRRAGGAFSDNLLPVQIVSCAQTPANLGQRSVGE